MRLPSLLLLLSSLTVSAAPFGETTRAAFGKLKEALLAEANIPGVNGGNPKQHLEVVQQQIAQLEEYIGDGTEAWIALSEMGNSLVAAHRSREVREIWGALIKAAGKESRLQTEALIARLKSLAGTAVRPEEFDEIIQQLDPAGFAGRTDSNSIYPKLQSARTFALGWQEYLAAKVSGDQNRITQSLSQLMGSNVNASQFVTRSKLLLEQFSAKDSNIPAGQITGILNGVMTPADLGRAIGEITQVMTSSRNSGQREQSMGQLVTALTNLQRLHAEFEAGLGIRLGLLNSQFGNQSSFEISEVALVRIRALVIRSILPWPCRGNRHWEDCCRGRHRSVCQAGLG